MAVSSAEAEKQVDLWHRNFATANLVDQMGQVKGLHPTIWMLDLNSI